MRLRGRERERGLNSNEMGYSEDSIAGRIAEAEIWMMGRGRRRETIADSGMNVRGGNLDDGKRETIKHRYITMHSDLQQE